MTADLSCFNWIKLIHRSSLNPNAKYLAHYLSTFMNLHQDMAWPSYARIIAETGLARSTVSKYLDDLERKGWLIRHRGNSTKTTEYVVSIPEAAIASAVGSTSGELGSTPRELGSTSGELGVVRQANSNNKVNNKGITKGSPYLEFAEEMWGVIQPLTNQKTYKRDQWADDIRKLVELDGQDVATVKRVFRSAHQDNFWRKNILSASALRRNFPKLYANFSCEQQPSEEPAI